jgi:hypothetical protein
LFLAWILAAFMLNREISPSSMAKPEMIIKPFLEGIDDGAERTVGDDSENKTTNPAMNARIKGILRFIIPLPSKTFKPVHTCHLQGDTDHDQDDHQQLAKS